MVRPRPAEVPSARAALKAWLQDVGVGGDVSIEVQTVDHLPGHRPTYRDIEGTEEGGRGLAIVHALSHGYSVLRSGHGRVTACRISRGAPAVRDS